MALFTKYFTSFTSYHLQKFDLEQFSNDALQEIAWNCDWFIALAAPVVIGRINCFCFGFSTVI